MNHILAKTTSRETMGNLLDHMEQPIQPLYYRRYTHQFVTEYDTDQWFDDEIAIRWGLTARVPDYIPDIVINNREAIKLASNKGGCRRVLNEAGIPVPEPVDIYSGGLIQSPVGRIVIRPNFHQKGRGWTLINNEAELRGWMSRHGHDVREYYASKYYPKTAEYRVHVAHGKVLVVQQKLQTSEVSGSAETPLNWNHESGYEFSVVPWRQYKTSIVSLAVQALAVVGLDFGAVDIMEKDVTDDGLSSAVVCEVNTAPKLEGYTAERYAEYFDWVLTTQETRHFEIPEGTQARHYVLKHRELREEEYDFNFKEDENV